VCGLAQTLNRQDVDAWAGFVPCLTVCAALGLADGRWESRKGWDALLAGYLSEFSAHDRVALYIVTQPFDGAGEHGIAGGGASLARNHWKTDFYCFTRTKIHSPW
jgi:hypothetical protein